jgi:hypothetical protein
MLYWENEATEKAKINVLLIYSTTRSCPIVRTAEILWEPYGGSCLTHLARQIIGSF